jgi:hypothetical protein
MLSGKEKNLILDVVASRTDRLLLSMVGIVALPNIQRELALSFGAKLL